jgi:hypothetical protein
MTMEWRYVIGIAVGGAIGFGIGWSLRSVKGG